MENKEIGPAEYRQHVVRASLYRIQSNRTTVNRLVQSYARCGPCEKKIGQLLVFIDRFCFG